VGAEDVGSGEDGGYIGGGGGVEAVVHRRGCAFEENRETGVLGDGACEEAFAGDACEERQVESLEFVEVREE